MPFQMPFQMPFPGANPYQFPPMFGSATEQQHPASMQQPMIVMVPMMMMPLPMPPSFPAQAEGNPAGSIEHQVAALAATMAVLGMPGGAIPPVGFNFMPGFQPMFMSGAFPPHAGAAPVARQPPSAESPSPSSTASTAAAGVTDAIGPVSVASASGHGVTNTAAPVSASDGEQAASPAMAAAAANPTSSGASSSQQSSITAATKDGEGDEQSELRRRRLQKFDQA